MKFLFAAESFSEEWRDYIYKKVGARAPLKDSLNIYGTADALILAHETPLSILTRRLANKDSHGLYKDIFKHDERVPSLVQYNPSWRYFEAVNDKLLFSSFSGIPLIRYDIGDNGNIIKYSEMMMLFKNRGIDIIKKAGLSNISNWKLPFLYVYGRDDLTASLYGINIYPENIRDALGRSDIDRDVSGKFVMFTKNDDKMNQYLEVIVELKDRIKVASSGLSNKIKIAVAETLKQKNNEYNELYKSLGAGAEPQVRLCEYGHKDLFIPGVKQKWHKKNVT
jgi:phenylacetate-CoA ligase